MAASKSLNPITLELIKNGLYSITDEMMITIIRTSRSNIIKNGLDFSTAVFNDQGEMVCSGAGLRVHLGAMPGAMQSFLKKYGGDINPGDVFILNDPFEGAMHLPDIDIFTPMFSGKTLCGFAATVCHHTDIGGRVAGGNASDSTNIYQEGLRIPPLKLFSRGQANEAIFALLETNVRTPALIREDLRAQVAACRVAEKRFLELVEKYGFENLKSYMAELLNYSERIARKEISTIPAGVYEFDDEIEGDATNPERIKLRVKIAVHDGSMTMDFSGSSPQVKSAINCNLVNTKAACYAAVREIIRARIPSNGGYFRPITVIADPGSICNAILPAPVAARSLVWARLVSLVLGALAKAVPERVAADDQGSPVGISIGGWDRERKPFVFVEFIVVGTGGRPTSDGVEGNLQISTAPTEMIEREFPLVIGGFGFVPDTGGAGTYRSGMAVERYYRLLADEAEVQVRSDRREVRAFGVQGGERGTGSEVHVYRANGEHIRVPGRATFSMYRGDTLRIVTPSGGGWGDPAKRSKAALVEDVKNGKFSLEYVQKHYNIKLD